MTPMTSDFTAKYPSLGIPQIVLFNLLVLVWWLELGLRIPVFASMRFEFLLAGLLTFLAITKAASHRKSAAGVETNSDITGCIVVYLIVLAISVPLAFDVNVAWEVFIDRVAKLALLGVLISQFVVSPLTLRICLFTHLLAFMKIGQEAFVGKLTGSMVWENQGIPRLHGSAETMFGHPNSLSGKTVSILPFIWYMYPVVQRNIVKSLLLLQVVFAINIIVFTGSRTGYVTTIAAALFIVMFSKGKRARLILMLIVASMITVLTVPQEYKERFISSFTGVEAEGQSSAARKALLTDSIGAFADNPLGVGLGNFYLYQAAGGRNPQPTHNLYTELLAETGIQGFTCFIVLLSLILRKAFRSRRALASIMAKLQTVANTGDDVRVMAELRDIRWLFATVNALIVFTLVRLSLGMFGHDFLEIYWWFAAGLAMSLHNMRLVAERRCDEVVARATTGGAITSSLSYPAGAAAIPTVGSYRVRDDGNVSRSFLR